MKIKQIILVFSLVSLMACLNDSEKKTNNTIEEDHVKAIESSHDSLRIDETNLELKKQQTIQIKREELIQKEDERVELQELVISKEIFKDEDLYVLDFKYPYLNESLKRSYINFNEYIQNHYVDIKDVEAQILEDKELFCDTIRSDTYKEVRKVDYKIYTINDKLISVLFYKENYYSGAMHPSYSFDCLNFDLNRSVFMKYEDFFMNNSEEELRAILNDQLKDKINSGDFFYDCWEISKEDFTVYKNNFVVNDLTVEFYFDDCVICPSYTGTYSIKIPLDKLLPVLRKYNQNPLVGSYN